MTAILTRRSLLRGLFAMPAVVAASSLMPVRGIIVPILDEVVIRGLDMYGATIEERIKIAYTITRKAIDDNLYRTYFASVPVDFGLKEITA